MQALASRSSLRHIVRIGAPLLLITLLGGCLLPPEPKTDAAEGVFNLYLLVLALAAIVFVGVEGFLIYAIFRYRRKPGDDTLPEQLHGNNTIEVIWTLIPTVIVMVLFIFSMISLSEVEARSEDPVTIEVEGFQWQWTFRYPDGGPTVNGTAADPPALVVPVNEPVRLVLSSVDVNHSFYVPEFLIKRDMIPIGETGTLNEIEFTVNEVGTYSGQCAEFCGTAHADMIFVVEAVERADYDAFVAGETAEPSAPAEGECGTTVEIKANNVQFDVDTIEVPADTEFCIAFENQEAVPHNVAIYDGGEVVFSGEILNQEGSITYVVPALSADGDYQFICEVHPTTMVGDVTVTQ